jgi:predicted ester cyclase
MTPEDLKARARRIPQELLTQGDLAVADEIFAADLVHHASAPHAPGVEGVKQWVSGLRRAFPDLHASVEDEIVEGNTVAQRLTLSGTHAGPSLGLSPTGTRATWQLVAIQRLGPDGKFAEYRVLVDYTGPLWQLSASPATAGASRSAGDAAEEPRERR